MDIDDAIAQIQQPRSRYMLETMILGEHDTAEMRFYQCVIEISDKLRKYQLAEVSRDRLERDIERLESSSDPDADLDLREKRIEHHFLVAVMRGAARELSDLFDIYNSIPHFSREEIDANQPTYWQARMTRQTEMQALAGNVQWAQLDALRQVGGMPLNGQGEINP
jgi:hypothetical protein